MLDAEKITKISEIAKLLRQIIGYEGKFKFDKSKDDVEPEKITRC